jgi:hypothetical protein
MAGDWIKMRISLAEDPAVIAMASALNESEFEVVGRLHHLWGWANVQSRDGHAPGVTDVWINRYVQRDGFAHAMVVVGWLVIDESGVSFPKFDLHNGESAKQRGLGAERKRNQREKVTQGAGQMSRLQRDISVTRGEEIREELKDGAKRGHVRIESQNDSTPASDASPPVVEIPLNDGTAYGVYAEQVSEWSLTYRNIDVPQELREMRQWCLANPKKKKTKHGVLAFANTWLAREQDKPSHRSGNGRAAEDPFAGAI